MARRTDAEMLMDLVPLDGSLVGNTTLMNKLEWIPEKYWRVRDNLIQAGQLQRGRGKGGSVCRTTAREPFVSTKTFRNFTETDLYGPLLGVLSKEWIRELGIAEEQIHFEITARQGKKDTGGKWTRPDSSGVSCQTFPHLPGKYFDVWTFEVKSVDALDATAVFEAASHASRATRSYALLQISEEERSVENEVIDRCVRDAARLKVGLITFSSASDFETWETKVEAPKLDTAPEHLNEFISHLSDIAKSKIAMWK